MYSDTSVEDHESQECDTWIATLERDFPRLQEEFLQAKATLEKHVEALKAEVLLLRTRPQCLDVILLSRSQIKLYTGLNPKAFFGYCYIGFNRFCHVEASWTHCCMHWKKMISPFPAPLRLMTVGIRTILKKLLLVLMHIRQGLIQEDQAFCFDVDKSFVSRFLNRWIPLLAYHLMGLIKWPSSTIGPVEPPYHHMPNTLSISDGTELFIQRPSNLSTQKSSYSEYKSHTTVKFLSIDPFTCVLNFMSTGFSGNSSERFVVENSGFLDVLKPTQRNQADRGFTARYLIARKSAFLTILSFLRSASK